MLVGGTWTTARRITIPLALPALLAGMLIAFLQAMTLFGSPAILALPAGFHTMTTKIWSLFQFPPKPELAAAASLPLLVLTVMLLRAQHMILGRKGYSVVGGKTGDPSLIRLGIWKWPAVAFVFGVLMLPVFLPYFALINAALSPIATTLVTPENATLKNVWFTFGLSSTRTALQNTFILGALTATVGTLMALVIGYIVVRRAIVGHQALGFLATAPIANPGHRARRRIVPRLHAAAICALRDLLDPAACLSHHRIAGGVPTALVGLRAVGNDLEDASRILGATRLQALRHITAPLLRTSVIATWCFIFVATIRELSAAIILFTSDTKVVSVLIFDLKESGDLGAIAVLGIMMLVLTFAVVIAINRIPGFGAAQRLRNTWRLGHSGAPRKRRAGIDAPGGD